MPTPAKANWAMPKGGTAAAGPGVYDELVTAAAEAAEAASAGGDEALLSLAESPRGRRTQRPQGKETGFRTMVGKSVLAPRESVERFADWWSRWRKTASFRVLLAFVLIYGLLAVMRKPSEVVLEQSRHAEEMAFLQDFLNSYTAAGGTVLAQRPHGGTELYPRGVLLQGEFLAAFQRAPVGGVFVLQTRNPETNPLLGFYGFPPIFVGGTYFHLDRKFNLSLYRFRFLFRKDSEEVGALLLARLDLVF